jgi:hypothetical protein
LLCTLFLKITKSGPVWVSITGKPSAILVGKMKSYQKKKKATSVLFEVLDQVFPF